MTVLKEYVQAVTDRQDVYKTAEAYYEGNVGEVFTNTRLGRALHRTNYNSRLNFCRPIVDAVLNRMEVKNVTASTKAAQDKLSNILHENMFDLESIEIHRRALEYGDCYAIVWPDEDGVVEIAYNSPRGMALVYDKESPRKKKYAVKIWQDDSKTSRMNVYFADRIEKYSVNNANPTEGSNWSLIDTVENPFGEVPVFHFRTQRPFGRPEHMDAFDGQDYINKEFVQSMITIDYQGAPQRYALATAGMNNEIADFNDDDTARENVNALKNGPGELWFLNGIDKVGEFNPADPDVFWKPIKDTVRAIASLTNTPLHYFERTGNIPSGEALRSAEAPLLKKVRDRCASFGQTWEEIFHFALKIEGISATVQVEWAEAESIDESERWDIALKKRNAGVSLEQVLSEYGYDSEVIPKIIEQARIERLSGDVTGYERSVRTNINKDETNEIGETE